MLVIRPYHGEFGLKVRFWVPQVHAACQQAGDVLVGHEPGMEALYPLASERVIEDGPATHPERAKLGRPPDLGYGESRFIPEPWEPQDVGYVDVVVCPRRSVYGKSKNWDEWPTLTARLQDAGLRTFAGGVASGSYHVAGPTAWDYDRPLDATIAAMRQARLVVATDAGLAHLAVLCGAPLLLVTYRGRVAPGPVVSSSGRKAQDEYWPVRWGEYYVAANHTDAPLTRINGWTKVGRVADAVTGLVA